MDHEAYHARWESQWTRDGGLKPGQAFDAARESPALAHALATGALDVRGKRVYVPGCGRGYDLPAFLRAGAAEVVGLEYAPTAQQEAAAFVASQLAPEEALRAPVHCGDFFRWACPSGLDFDVGYDYTFFW